MLVPTFARSMPPVGNASPAGSPVSAPIGQTSAGERAAASLSTTLDVTLQRLEEVVEQETAALRAGGRVDIKSFNERKSQILLELTRLLRHVKGMPENPQLEKRMGQVQSKLAINQAVLKVHVEAVKEIAGTLSNAIREADSDGTYSPSIYGSAKRQ